MMARASFHSLDESGIRERWLALLAESVIRTPFSDLGYIEDLAQISGRSVHAVFVSDPDDVAGALVFSNKIGPLEKVSAIGFTPFSGIAARRLPTAAEIHGHESWDRALAEALGERFSRVDLLLPPDIIDVRAFQWLGWQASPLYTFQLSLQASDHGLSSWSESTRRLFARSRARFRLMESPDYAAAIVDLCLDSYERQNRAAPLDRSALTRLVIKQVERNTARCFVLFEESNDVPSAGVVVLSDRVTAYYWVSGSKPGAGMTVMIGELMERLSAEGLATFDFVGANTPSIAEFKRRFNPKLVPYFMVRGIRSRVLRIFFTLMESLQS